MRLTFVLIAFLFASSICKAKDSNILHHATATFEGAFDRTGMSILIFGTAATIVSFSFDQQMHDAWKGNQRMGSDVSAFGNFWGSGIPEGGIALTQLIFDTEHGIAATEGLLSSTVVTFGIKYATARPRPDSDTRTAFPSGHTQIAFASATSILMSYGVASSIPSFGLGVLTGLSRLADNAHWFSDIVGGTVVGIIFGRAGFKHHFTVTPMAFEDGERGFGLVYAKHF